MRIIFCVTCYVLLLCAQVYAQPICGFDESNRTMKQNDPAYRSRQLLNEQKLSSIIQQRKIQKREQQGLVIYNIPIVVHILHTGGEIGSIYNPDDAQVKEAIDYLNQVYDGTHPSLTPAGTDAAGDIGLRFVFAQRDPDCNPTNGIVRVDMSANAEYLTTGAKNNDIDYDIALKTPLAWDQTRYYNIYVVSKINGQDGTAGQFIAGYAFFPTDNIVDGIVMLATQMKADSKTLSHEVGHAFNLYHPFETSSLRTMCPDEWGDHVDDTDPISFNISSSGVVNFTCRTGNNSCNNGAPFSIRTENNFMNYTNCYTLFTPGQRDRMMASLLLDERKTLITSTAIIPTYEAAVCPPAINFETGSGTIVNASVLEAGCRSYKDHTFAITIANSPIAQAVVALSVDPSSVAKEGLDFDFPTGKNVTFPVGVRDKRSFTLRVYDNGNFTDTKKLKLNFTVNNGGGNAIKGTANPSFTLLMRARDHSPVVPGTPSSGKLTGTDYNINDAHTFDASIRKQKTQIIYKASELHAAGIVAGRFKGIQFFLQKQSTRPFKNLGIKLKHTNVSNLASNGSITPVTTLTTVCTKASYTTVNGWNNFAFSTPFDWNGIDNVAVEICFDNLTTATDDVDILGAYSDGGSEEQGNMIVNEGISCGENFSQVTFYPNGIKPTAIIDYEKRGNPVGTSVVSSHKEYLGPKAEIFFYDNANPRKVITSIKNLDNWNYGCVEVKVDRAGNGTVPFWNNTPLNALTRKSFFIQPDANNASGNFEITFYFSKAEKEGYEGATGNDWNNIRLIKTEVPVSTITPGNQQADKVEINGEVEHISYGTDFAIRGTFHSGFSGFSAGVVDIALPVTWLDFKASPVNGNVLLNWSTATEINNKDFEIEVSGDGSSFNLIDKVASKGNSSNTTSYSYVHTRPLQNALFYRIRQVNIDGTFSYSKIIRIELAKNKTPYLFPVPATNNVTVHFGKPVANVMVEILSSDMKKLYAEKLTGIQLMKNIEVAYLPAGTYFVRVYGGTENYVLKFLKY